MSLGRVVVVGSSVGGVRAAQGLRAEGYRGEIVVVGAEDNEPYDKPPLSKELLAGAIGTADLRLAGEGEWADSGITLRLGVAAGWLDVANHRLGLVDGSTIEYDKLVIATGVRARTIGGEGNPLVHTVRGLADARALSDALGAGGPLVVIGGGFIGAEIASTAAALGVESTIVEAMPTPFSRVLGTEVGALVEDLHVRQGVRVISGAGVIAVEARGSGRGLVHLSGGRSLGAAVVVAGIGCLPNTEWLASSGISLEDGVVTDQHCRSVNVADVYAIGDVARWLDVRTNSYRRVEHWTHAFQQAQLVAHNIVHADDLREHIKAPYFWSDQHGVRMQMTGRNAADDKVEVLHCATPAGKRNVALYSAAGRFTAGVAFDWPKVLPKLRRAWEQDASLDDARRLVEESAS